MRRRCCALVAAVLAVVSVALLAGPASAQTDVSTDPSAPAGVWVRHIVKGLHAPDGTDRVFFVRQPIGAPAGAKNAVLLLHGLQIGGLTAAKDDGWDTLADEKGIILIAGQGWKGSWSAGGCCGAAAGVEVGKTAHSQVNDVVAQARSSLSLTPNPILARGIAVVGFSNGGMLAADWACTRQDDVVAVTVAGPLLTPTCGHKVHLLHLHGVHDTSVPVFGGFSKLTHTFIPDSRLERAKIPRGSAYSLLYLDMTHRWGPPGQALVLTSYISAWIDHQRNGRSRAGA